MNICCCCLHKVNKLVEIKNEPRDLLANVNKLSGLCEGVIRREAIEIEGLVFNEGTMFYYKKL